MLAVGEVWDDTDDVLRTGGLEGIRHDQELHNGCVDISDRLERLYGKLSVKWNSLLLNTCHISQTAGAEARGSIATSSNLYFTPT